MSVDVGLTWTLQGGFWRRAARPAIIAGDMHDDFQLGVTEPTAANTGVYPDVIRLAYDGPAAIEGYATLAEAAKNPIASRNIDRLLTINSGYVCFVNCKFTSGGATFDTGQVDCRKAAVLGVSFDRCTFDPAKPSPYLNALIGHHMNVNRCHARRVVDFIGVYNTTAPRVDTFITGNYLESLVYYYDPTVGVVHPSDNRTHNDGIQKQGGIGFTCRGNALHGYVFLPDGSVPNEDPTRAAYAHLASQGVIIQENVAIGGVYYGGEDDVSENFIYGFMHPFSFKTRSTGGAPFGVKHEKNLLMNDDQRYYGSTELVPGYPGRPYIVRTGSQTWTNDQTDVPMDGQPYPASGENRYHTSTAVERAALRGQLVTVRRDNFPGS